LKFLWLLEQQLFFFSHHNSVDTVSFFLIAP